jgi:rhodanese-related sulfurtransferase
MKLLTPHEAHTFLQATPDAVFMDIRSFAEFWFVGHPVGAMSVPFNDEEYGFNAKFIDEAASFAKRTQAVVLICRSGKRTLEAGAALEGAGFINVAHVTTGFEGEMNTQDQRSSVNGWRFEGLPWEQG